MEAVLLLMELPAASTSSPTTHDPPWWMGTSNLSSTSATSSSSSMAGNVSTGPTSYHSGPTMTIDRGDDGDELVVFPAYMSLLMTLSCSLILVVGLIGNCLVPVVIWNNRDLRNSTNLFLLNLSLADILVLGVSMPTVLVEIHHRPEVWILGQVMCKLVPFVELTVAHASVLTILAISFERYYVITRPLRAGYTCTRMRALLVILAIWILGCITSSPMLFIANYMEDASAAAAVDDDLFLSALSSTPITPTLASSSTTAQCVTQANTFWPTFYFISAICLFFFFPLLVLILIYSVIARHLVADPRTTSNHRIQVQTSANSGSDVNPNLRARRQVVAMLGTVVVFFFICLLPFRLFTLWIILTPDEEMQSMSVETYYHALNFCRVMLYLNSAINPILYNVMSSKFRTAFLKALGLTWAAGGPLRRRKRLLRHLSRQSTFNTTTTLTATTSGASGGSHSHHGGTSQAADGQRELIRHLTKDALLGESRPTLQKYGRQGSCSNTAYMTSFSSSHNKQSGLSPSAVTKPLISTATSAATAAVLVSATTVISSSAGSHQSDDEGQQSDSHL